MQDDIISSEALNLFGKRIISLSKDEYFISRKRRYAQIGKILSRSSKYSLPTGEKDEVSLSTRGSKRPSRRPRGELYCPFYRRHWWTQHRFAFIVRGGSCVEQRASRSFAAVASIRWSVVLGGSRVESYHVYIHVYICEMRACTFALTPRLRSSVFFSWNTHLLLLTRSRKIRSTENA